MTTENSANQPKPETGLKAIKTFLNSEGIREKFAEMLGRRAPQFITSVMQIVSSNKDLSSADVQSVYNAAATAAILDLPLNSNLQFAHIVGYKDNKRGGVVYAQFQMGWRGFVQLAQRSGQFQTVNVTDVREGELVKRDRLTGECVFKWEDNEEERASKKIIGFVSYFRLVNGFEKQLYKTVEQLREHGKKYSKTYNREDGKWNTDFDAMCSKTVIKEILNKFAPLSVEMQTAIRADQSIIGSIDEGKFEYPDNPIQDADELSDEEAADIERKTRADQAKLAEEHAEAMLKAGANKKEDKK